MRAPRRSGRRRNSSHTVLSVCLGGKILTARCCCNEIIKYMKHLSSLGHFKGDISLPLPLGSLRPSVQSESSVQMVDGFGCWRRNHQCEQ